jgi:hypothetical protein
MASRRPSGPPPTHGMDVDQLFFLLSKRYSSVAALLVFLFVSLQFFPYQINTYINVRHAHIFFRKKFAHKLFLEKNVMHIIRRY